MSQRNGIIVAIAAIAFWILIITIAALTSSSSKSSPKHASKSQASKTQASTTRTSVNQDSTPHVDSTTSHARDWIAANGSNARLVASEITSVRDSLKANPSDLYSAAGAAQQAHDDLDAVRNDFLPNTFDGELGNAEGSVLVGANDLKNAMGALVAATGDPNPATVAQFGSKFQKAASEWNGVTVIWRLAHRANPPVV